MKSRKDTDKNKNTDIDKNLQSEDVVKKEPKAIVSPYVENNSHRKMNILDLISKLKSELSEVEEDMKDAEEAIEDIEDEMQKLEEMLESISKNTTHKNISPKLARENMQTYLDNTILGKFINANILEYHINTFISFEDMMIPQAVFFGLCNSLENKKDFDEALSTYLLFHHSIVESISFRKKVERQILLDVSMGKVEKPKPGDVIMGVINTGELIKEYVRGVEMMKEMKLSEAIMSFDIAIKKLWEQKTVFTDIYKLYGNMGIAKVMLDDETGFDFINMALIINPKYTFLKKQLVSFKTSKKVLHKEYIQSKTKGGKIETKGDLVYMHIPTVAEYYLDFILKLKINFTNI